MQGEAAAAIGPGLDAAESRLGGERPHGDRSVDVLVRRLRRKVDETGGRYTYVQTEHRVGYRLEAIAKAFPVGRRRV